MLDKFRHAQMGPKNKTNSRESECAKMFYVLSGTLLHGVIPARKWELPLASDKAWPSVEAKVTPSRTVAWWEIINSP